LRGDDKLNGRAFVKLLQHLLSQMSLLAPKRHPSMLQYNPFDFTSLRIPLVPMLSVEEGAII
jgi:hypothetical protein